MPRANTCTSPALEPHDPLPLLRLAHDERLDVALVPGVGAGALPTSTTSTPSGSATCGARRSRTTTSAPGEQPARSYGQQVGSPVPPPTIATEPRPGATGAAAGRRCRAAGRARRAARPRARGRAGGDGHDDVVHPRDGRAPRPRTARRRRSARTTPAATRRPRPPRRPPRRSPRPPARRRPRRPRRRCGAPRHPPREAAGQLGRHDVHPRPASVSARARRAPRRRRPRPGRAARPGRATAGRESRRQSDR
jgi:hypothetical protein